MQEEEKRNDRDDALSVKKRDLKNPDEMNNVLGDVLRAGVILSAFVIALGLVSFLLKYSNYDASAFIAYDPAKVPHGDFSTNLAKIPDGLLSLNPFSIIELGLLILIATPVARVLLSIFLFYFEGDRKYVYITLGVLLILLFSMFIVPFLP